MTMVDKMVMRRGPKLNAQQQAFLNADCTKIEVQDALFSMISNKAPGFDGFNVYFVKKNWHIIGRDVILAVQQFFQTGEIPTEINMALITLIPKFPNASSVKEFCPIACCSVLYKIISKIIAYRMKRVLDTVIGEVNLPLFRADLFLIIYFLVMSL